MPRRLALVLLALAAPLAASATASAAQDRYIVVLKASEPRPGAVAQEQKRKFGAEPDKVFHYALKGYSARIPAAKLEALRNDPDVVSVTRDREVHALDTATLAAGDSVPTGILREGAAAGTTVQHASSSAVAVIDTGMDLTHPDLPHPAAGDVVGTNCVTPGSAPNDDNGHGSHVSGTIGALNNGAGVVGAVPGNRIYAVKVLNAQGSGTASQVICGIDWVTQNAAALGIKVANMSLGGGGTPIQACSPTMTDAEHLAICNATAAGVTFVVAAGNSGYDYDYALAPDTPAAYPEVLTVTAMSDSDGQPGAAGGAPTCRTGELDDKYATFSNYATSSTGIGHTIAGPGVCIRSTWMNGGYNTISGTSMASPNIAGVVASCLDDTSATGCAGKAPAQVIAQMRSNAAAHATSSNGFTGDPAHALSGRYYGYLGWGGVTSSGTAPPPAPTGTFSLTATPSSLTATRGGTSVGSDITITRDSFPDSVALSARCPSKVSCSLSPTSTTANSSRLTVAAARNAKSGSYTVTVTGTSGAQTRSTDIVLTVR